MAATPPVSLSVGDRRHGFVVERVEAVPEARATAIQAIHEKSGARLLHLASDDSENLFTIAFRTPPPDDTGLPHILEHTVLCGSKRYPVKDPFVELLKTSLATFLNAMTYADKTVYPCASMNRRDFYNLAGVYCDAVFHPNITRAHFEQEGHHLDFATPGDAESALIVKGIVYNEMKGAYSDLDGVIDREELRSICPDNAYGLDSGGDPEAIPSLSYEAFVDFHRRYYHPSNAFLFTYGDLDPVGHMEFLDKEYLAAFDRIEIDTTIQPQPRWDRPRAATIPYPLGAHEDPARKSAVVLNYLAGDATDPLRTLAMHVLAYYLVGNAASPLRKALIDSHLGEELTGSGFYDWSRDTVFTVGLKGTDPEKAEAIADLVRETCAAEAARGLDAAKLEAAFHRLRLASCEIGSSYPIRLMDRVYRGWLYEADPLNYLRIRTRLEELLAAVAATPRYLEDLLVETIAENPHHALLTFVPDKELTTRQEAAFAARMAATQATLDAEARAAIATRAAELEAMQNAPNPPEALATLPTLSLADVPKEPLDFATHEEEIAGRPLLTPEVFGGGLSYLKIGFDLRGLPEEFYDDVPIYTALFAKVGAAGLDYVAMAEREAACCGGVAASEMATGRVEDPDFCRPRLSVSCRALDDRLPAMLSLLRDRLTACDFGDRERVRDVLLQARLHRRSELVSHGSDFARRYAARHLSRNAALNERFLGVTHLRRLEAILDAGEAGLEALIERMEWIRHFLQARGRTTFAAIGTEASLERIRAWAGELLAGMRDETPPVDAGPFAGAHETREALATPADVAFVARALPVVPGSHPDAPALVLLGLQLSFGYLWNEIRAKRGAYGAHASYNALLGVLSLTSYRDPYIVETLATYGETAKHVTEAMALDPAAVEQAIIGTVKTLDRPWRPSEALRIAMMRHYSGDTPAFRAQFRERLLSLTGEDLRRVAAEVIAPALANAPTCVLSSREKLVAANQALAEADVAPLAIEDI